MIYLLRIYVYLWAGKLDKKLIQILVIFGYEQLKFSFLTALQIYVFCYNITLINTDLHVLCYGTIITFLLNTTPY